jgi:hypothetical protein
MIRRIFRFLGIVSFLLSVLYIAKILHDGRTPEIHREIDAASPTQNKVKKEPNNAVEPTPVDVTIPAAQEVAPSTSAAHLGR